MKNRGLLVGVLLLALTLGVKLRWPEVPQQICSLALEVLDREGCFVRSVYRLGDKLAEDGLIPALTESWADEEAEA